MAEILYNEIYPKGATTKNIVAKSKDVKYAKAGTTIVYDTFEEYTYGTPVITVEYKTVLSRNGGSIKPTVTYSLTRTKRGFSERAYESETISGTVESFTASGKILNSSEATIDTSNGTVSRDSLGTTYKSATWNIMEVTVTATINGVSASGTGIAKMLSNTYTDSGGVTTYSDVVKGSITHGYIPASGGEATATATAGSQDWYTSEVVRTFLTKSTKVITPAESGTDTINGTTLTVSKDSKGTDISNVTVAGTKTVTWTGLGNKSATGTLYVYQNANYVTELTLSGGGLAYDTFTAAGTTKTPKTSTSKTVTFKFTSGNTTTTVPSSTYGSLSRTVSYGMTTATGFTLNSSSTGSITASNNKSTSARSTTAYRYEKATWTPSSSYPDADTINSSQGSNSCTVSLSAGYYSYSSWSVSISASPISGISAKGGSSTVTASASRTYGWNGATSGVGTQSGTIKLSIPSAVSGSSLSGTASGSTLTWSANYSTSARGVKVRATCQENTSVYKEVTITQNGDTKSSTTTEYSVSISANRYTSSSSPCPAAGGSATLTYSGSTRERYDWVSGDVTYSEWVAATPEISGSATGFTRDGTSVTISSLGVGTKNARSVTYTAKVGTASKSVTIYQQANAVTSTAYKFSTFSLSKTSFTAAGGSATLSMVVLRQYTYTSTSKGDWTTITPSSRTLSVSAGTGGSVGSISYGSTSTCTITVAAYTNTSSNRTISISGNYNSGSATASTSITQTKDAISSYGDISLTKGSVSVIPAKGGTVTSSGSSASLTVYYVSGRTRAGSVTVTEGSKTAGSKGTTISNLTSVGTLTISASGEGSKTTSGTLTVYQAANYVTAVTYTPADSVTSQRHFYYGGACVAAVGGTKAATLNGNSILTFSSGSTKTGSSHTGVSISFSRTFTKTDGAGSVDASGTITFDNNKSTAMRYCYVSSTLTIKVTHDTTYSGTGKGGTCTTTSTGETSCCQAAGYYSYAAWIVSISANPTTISAAGGSSTITASASRTYGWNGTTSGVGTQNGTVTLSIPTTTGASLSGNTLTWTANTSTTERSVAVTATCKEDTSKTKSVTVKQNKDTISSYSAPTFDMWYTGGNGSASNVVKASGGTVNPSINSFSQTVNWVSGNKTYITDYTGATLSYAKGDEAGKASLTLGTDGKVTVGSLGTTELNYIYPVLKVNLSITLNGKTGTDEGWVGQDANTKSVKGGVTTYGAVTAGTITNKTIPAGGTTTNYTATAGNGSQTYSTTRKYYLYTSGSEETITNAASGSVAVAPSHASISATASTKGTTISEANIVKSQTVTWASLDGTASKNKTSTMYIYLAANYVISVSPYASNSTYNHFYYYSTVSAAGGSLSPSGNGAATFTFSSGSKSSSGSAGNILGGTVSYKRTYSLTATTGASMDSTGKVTWTANTSTSKRSATVSSTLTVTYTHPSGINNGKAVSRTLNGTATCSLNADSITNSTVSYSGLKCTLTNNLTASGGSATVKVTTLKTTTHTWASGKNPTYEYVNKYDVTSSATKTIDHATLFNTSGAVIEASTRFSISGATVSHSSMLDKVGIDKVCVKAVFSGLTAHSDYAGVQNSRTDKRELTNVSVSYANASYVGGVNIAPSKSATYKVTPTYTSGFSGTTTTSTVTPNIDSYSITGTGCSKGSTMGYIIWSANPNTASRSATITGTVAHLGITSSFSTTAWLKAKPANTLGCDVTFVNKTSCVAQITFTNCETSFVSIPPNSTQYYSLVKAPGTSGSVINASVYTSGTCTLKLKPTGFYCMSPHTSTTCTITTS